MPFNFESISIVKTKIFLKIILISVLFLLFSTYGIKGAKKVDGNVKRDSINKIIKSTLKVSPKLKKSEYITKAAEYEVRQAKGGYYPTLYFDSYIGAESWSDTWSRADRTNTDFDRKNSASIGLIQNLFSGFETKNQVAKAKAIYEGADNRWTDTELSLARDTILSYLEVYRQRKLEELSEKNIKDYEEDMNGKIEIKDDTDLGLAKWRFEEAKRILDTDNYQFKISAINFYYLTEKNPKKKIKDEIVVLPKELKTLGNSIILLPEKFQDKAIANNADLKALKADVKSTEKQQEIIKGRFYPTVDIELNSAHADYEDQPYTVDHQALFRVKWDFYNGGSDKAAKKAAMKITMAKISEKEDREREIKEEISERYMEWEKAKSQIRKLEAEIKENEITLGNFKIKYNKNQISLKDFYDTRRNLFTNERYLISEQVNKIIAATSIRTLCGDLIEKLNEFVIYKKNKIKTHVDMR